MRYRNEAGGSLLRGVCVEDCTNEIRSFDYFGSSLSAILAAFSSILAATGAGDGRLDRYFVWRGAVRFGLSEVFGPRLFVRDEPIVSVGAVHDRKFTM